MYVKVLIVTDRSEHWDKLINLSLSNVKRQRRRIANGVRISNALFRIDLINDYSDRLRGQRYGCVILDREIEHEKEILIRILTRSGFIKLRPAL